MNNIGMPKTNNIDEESRGLKDVWRKVNEANKLTQKLESQSKSLPRMDEDGGSDCPFAEELYAKKEEVEEKLAAAVQALESCLPLLDREISRCRSNLAIISSDRQKLNSQEAGNGYSAAEGEVTKQLRKAVGDRKSVVNALKRARTALEIAKSQKFPGRKPQRPKIGGTTSKPVIEPKSTAPGSVSDISKPSLDSKIEGVLSTGPLK